jgi:hypothetical protein
MQINGKKKASIALPSGQAESSSIDIIYTPAYIFTRKIGKAKA